MTKKTAQMKAILMARSHFLHLHDNWLSNIALALRSDNVKDSTRIRYPFKHFFWAFAIFLSSTT